MDELAKTEARNYLCAAGFFMLAAWTILSIFNVIGSTTFVLLDDKLIFAIGIGLLIVATLLVVLRKRDTSSLLFLMMGIYCLICAFTSFGTWNYIIIGILVLIILVTLTGQDKKKWLLFLSPLFFFINNMLTLFIGYNLYVAMVISTISAVIALYYALCCACERCRLPGAKILTSDESTDFKASGSVLGYMLFALLTGGYALHYILGETALPIATFQTIELLCGSLMVFIAILLLTVGQMRFTPIMFLLIGLSNILAMYSSGAMFIGIGILFIVIGLFAMLRKESRILPGIMLIVYACTAFFSALAGSMPSAPVVSIILNAIPCLIAIYLAFVVYSQRKLPKF